MFLVYYALYYISLILPPIQTKTYPLKLQGINGYIKINIEKVIEIVINRKKIYLGSMSGPPLVCWSVFCSSASSNINVSAKSKLLLLVSSCKLLLNKDKDIYTFGVVLTIVLSCIGAIYNYRSVRVIDLNER